MLAVAECVCQRSGRISTGTLELPFTQVWIAFAPGGLEAMAAMAIALGFDPAYVGTHHILRFIGLALVVPIWMRGLRSAGQ